jgi:hypothetical protein
MGLKDIPHSHFLACVFMDFNLTFYYDWVTLEGMYAAERLREKRERVGGSVGTKDSRSTRTSRSIIQRIGSVSHRAQEQIDRRTYGPSYWKPDPSLVEELAQTNKTNARDQAI